MLLYSQIYMPFALVGLPSLSSCNLLRDGYCVLPRQVEQLQEKILSSEPVVMLKSVWQSCCGL